MPEDGLSQPVFKEKIKYSNAAAVGGNRTSLLHHYYSLMTPRQPALLSEEDLHKAHKREGKAIKGRNISKGFGFAEFICCKLLIKTALKAEA